MTDVIRLHNPLTDTVRSKAEVAAGRPRPCGKTEFTCGNQRCIPVQLQCDLFSDCGDGGSDEQDCKTCKQMDYQKKNKQSWKRHNKNNSITVIVSGCLAVSSFEIVCFDIYVNICITTEELRLCTV